MEPDIIKPQKSQAKEATPVPIQSDQKISPLIPVTIILAGIIIAGSIFFSGKETPKLGGASKLPITAAEENRLADPRPVSASDHILGNPGAKVFIIEYSDLECEFCKEFHPTMHKIIDEFGKGGEVAWVYRQFPIKEVHSKAITEAEASECSAELGGNAAFWKYVDRVFEITPSGDGLDLGKLPEIAAEIGLDVTAFNECLASGRTTPKIEADIADAIASGASGTPYVHIISKNGKRSFGGGQPYLALRIMINQSLAE